MPCDSSGYPPAGDDYEARRQIKAMKEELDKVTSMLCSLLRTLDDTVSVPPDVVQWFHEHRAHDKAQGRP
jgi:hypothetical protein